MGSVTYPLAERTSSHPATTVVEPHWKVRIGGPEVVLIAGPCAAENAEQVDACAGAASRAGAKMLRGGAFKPRTSPYSFQGLGEEGLLILRVAADRHGLLLVSEVLDTRDVDLVGGHVDMYQIGSRNMQNYALLKAVGQTRKPVLLKRGMCATIEEWLCSAEYILHAGNPNVILCERGIRSFSDVARFTLDIGAIPIVHRMSHLPIIVDPSHAAGDAELIPALTHSAVAAGADGIMVEIHPNPNSALCDGKQALSFSALQELSGDIGCFAKAAGRTFNVRPRVS